MGNQKIKTCNGFGIPSLILGTFRHRDRSVLKEVVMASIERGIIGFDTAPSYRTEKALGEILNEVLSDSGKSRDEIFISTKIDAWQMQDSNGRVERYVDEVLRDMNLKYLDQLLIHWPIPEYLLETWESFVRLYESGRVKVIGVCNVRERHLLKLMDGEITPMVVQNERHPLRTDEFVLEFCKRHNIVYEAYSPVGQMMEGIRDSELLRRLGEKYGKTIGQIIMRWHIDTGSVPVFMTKRRRRIFEVSEVSGFQLDGEDVISISSLNLNYKIFLESAGCPGF